MTKKLKGFMVVLPYRTQVQADKPPIYSRSQRKGVTKISRTLSLIPQLLPDSSLQTSEAPVNCIRTLPVGLMLCIFICACSPRVEMKSIHTLPERRYSADVQKLVLRPGNAAITVPFNELWAVHTNPVSRGWQQNEPYVGEAWDRVEVRFVLLPEIRKRTAATEQVFSEPRGQQLLRVTLMEPMGGDGDTRTAWKIARLEPIAGVSSVVQDAARAAGAYPAPLVAQHRELGLDEYEGKDEYGSRFFRSENTIVRCWTPPLSAIQHVCESSFNLANGLLVNVEFSYESLPRWKELLAFGSARAIDYAVR